MKIVIVSDIHANAAALEALPDTGDELWVLGDLVNYGPDPRAVIDFVRKRATLVIRGNHDDAIGFERDPRCSRRFREMARETAEYTRAVLSEEEKQYLRSLPLGASRTVEDVRFRLVHATLADPLYDYRRDNDETWEREADSCGCDVLLTGHTHIPFARDCAGTVVCNPGSIGQPKNGSPNACYAVWQNGRIELKSIPYPVSITVEKIRALNLSPAVTSGLVETLMTGRVPA
jgi:putative phosphoesterase